MLGPGESYLPRLTVVACGGSLVVSCACPGYAIPSWYDVPAPGGTDANLTGASGSPFTFGETPMEREARSVQAVASCSLEAALSRALVCLMHPAAYLLVYYQLI